MKNTRKLKLVTNRLYDKIDKHAIEKGNRLMKIRLATKEDLGEMREVFNYGRKVQLESGNPTQWALGYPSDELILEDIAKGAAYLCLNDQEELLAVFSVFTDPDSTYYEIDGEWLNDEPYATIHRIATNGKERGVGQYCIEWVQDQYDNVRIDTHNNNQQMKHILKKLGFKYCGVIYLSNGDSRNAYHYSKK